MLYKRDVPVDSIAWHPYKHVFAVAHYNDAIFAYNMQKQTWFPDALRHEFQVDIAAMEWRPLAGSQLAVACRYQLLLIYHRNGICLWNIPLGVEWLDSAPPPAAWMTYLRHPRMHSVNTLSFSPRGTHLIAASRAENVPIMVWEMSSGNAVILSDNSGLLDAQPVEKISWSPDGRYVIACIGTELRIWDCENEWNSRTCQDLNSHITVFFGSNSRICAGHLTLDT